MGMMGAYRFCQKEKEGRKKRERWSIAEKHTDHVIFPG